MVFIRSCGELTLAGYQLLTKLYSAPLHQKDRGEKMTKGLWIETRRETLFPSTTTGSTISAWGN